jgi:hypothetical protein
MGQEFSKTLDTFCEDTLFKETFDKNAQRAANLLCAGGPHALLVSLFRHREQEDREEETEDAIRDRLASGTILVTDIFEFTAADDEISCVTPSEVHSWLNKKTVEKSGFLQSFALKKDAKSLELIEAFREKCNKATSMSQFAALPVLNRFYFNVNCVEGGRDVSVGDLVRLV